MGSGELVLLILFLVVSGLLIGLSVPLLLGLIPPNGLYGFRTPRTLNDPRAWYAANRVSGVWGVLTGIATAAVSVYTYAAGMTLPTAPLLTLAVVLAGIAGTIIHGVVASRGAAPPDVACREKVD